MPICNACTAGLTNKTPGLKCSGACSSFYHGKCVGLSRQNVENFKLPGAVWFCPDCRPNNKQKRPSLPPADGDAEETEDEFENQTSSTLKIVKTIQSHMMVFDKKTADMLNSVNFCSEKISDFEAMMGKVNQRLEMIERLSKENAQLKADVRALSDRVDTLEQQMRSNNVDIQGIPEKQNENLFSIVQKIGEHINCPISSQDIDAIFRAKSRNPNNPKPIIIKLFRKKKRDDILAAAKNKRQQNETSTPGLTIEGISNKLFINEHLTGLTKSLLNAAKGSAKTKNYKYVWVREGGVYVRKEDQSRIIRIFSEDDVKKM